MPAPSSTYNAEGNVRTSSSLAAAGTANYDLDTSAIFQHQVVIKNTPGGTVAATRGVRVDVYLRYGTTPTTAPSPTWSYTLPSQTASTAESVAMFLETGKWNVKVTNLDASNAVTVEITSVTVDAVA